MKHPNPIGYTARKANKDHTGSAKFATNAQVVTGTAADLIVSPLSLAGAVDDLMPDATTVIAGKVLLNTDGTLAGADNSTVPTALATKTYADALAIAGAPVASETVAGIGELATNAEAVAGTPSTGAVALFVTPSNLASVMAAPGAIGGTTPAAGSFTTLATSGLASLSASATILTAGAALNLGSDNDSGAVNIGVGTSARAIGIGSSAAAHVVTIGSVTGGSQVILNSGTAGIQLASTGAGDITINSDDTLLLDADGVLELNSSAGVIGIGNDADANNINIGTGAAARTITVGNSSGATSVVLDSGTGAINIGTNAVAHTVTIGNSTGATAVVIDVGTGNFDVNGVGASTYAIGASTTTGTIVIGGTSGTGTMTFGDSDGTQIVQIGSGEGASTVAIAGGATSAKAVDIAIGAVANVVRIGTVTGAASMALKVGTGNFTLEGDVASTYEISSTGINTGTCKFASGTGARTVEIAGGGTGIKTINIGAAATADVITIGTTTGAGSLALKAGSGKVNVSGDLNIADTGKGLQIKTGAATDMAGSGTLVAGVATISNTNIATGDLIFVSRIGAAASTTLGVLTYTIIDATSFTVTSKILGTPGSTQTGDASTFAYFIVRGV